MTKKYVKKMLTLFHTIFRKLNVNSTSAATTNLCFSLSYHQNIFTTFNNFNQIVALVVFSEHSLVDRKQHIINRVIDDFL